MKKLEKQMRSFSNLAKIMRGEKVERPKPRKKRAVETQPRNMGEKKLEREIIMRLRNYGCTIAKAGEQSTYNSHYVLSGTSDLIVYAPGSGVIFMEVKQEFRRNTKNGGLSKSQIEFRELCKSCYAIYEVVYSVADAIKVINAHRADGRLCNKNQPTKGVRHGFKS